MQYTFDAFGLTVSVCSEVAGLADALQRRLPAFPAARGRPAVNYRLLADKRGRLVLLKDRRTLRIDTGFTAAVNALVQDLQTSIARLAPGSTLLHAGVVGIGSSVLVLPGSPGAGKSTLVAALVRAGADYASDEFAIIDRRGCVASYRRWLALREGDAVRHVPAEELTTRFVTDSRPVTMILFTEFRAGSMLCPRRLSAAECVLKLLTHCPGARARPLETLRALRAAAESATRLESVRGEAEEAARCLFDTSTRLQFAAEQP